jgi:hypothetical protein
MCPPVSAIGRFVRDEGREKRNAQVPPIGGTCALETARAPN